MRRGGGSIIPGVGAPGGCCGGAGGSLAAPTSPLRFGSSGVANSGGGGGGSGGSTSAGLGCGGGGGSGVVILAYCDTNPTIACVAAGLTYSYVAPGPAPARPGYRVYCFTAGTGTICW